LFTPEPRSSAPPQAVIPYPKGIARWLLRSPLLLHRLGLGGLLNQAHLVVLTTRGNKSGLPRHTVVEYRMHGTKVYLISGWGNRPHWIKNLAADPVATVQAGNRVYGATAYIVQDSAEILRALFLFRKRAPAVFDALIARMTDSDAVSPLTLPNLTNQLTVVRLDITRDAHTLPGMRRDLTWVWAVGAALIGGVMAIRLGQQLWQHEDEDDT